MKRFIHEPICKFPIQINLSSIWDVHSSKLFTKHFSLRAKEIIFRVLWDPFFFTVHMQTVPSVSWMQKNTVTESGLNLLAAKFFISQRVIYSLRKKDKKIKRIFFAERWQVVVSCSTGCLAQSRCFASISWKLLFTTAFEGGFQIFRSNWYNFFFYSINFDEFLMNFRCFALRVFLKKANFKLIFLFSNENLVVKCIWSTTE